MTKREFYALYLDVFLWVIPVFFALVMAADLRGVPLWFAATAVGIPVLMRALLRPVAPEGADWAQGSLAAVPLIALGTGTRGVLVLPRPVWRMPFLVAIVDLDSIRHAVRGGAHVIGWPLERLAEEERADEFFESETH